MNLVIQNPVQSTAIFLGIFITALLLSYKKRVTDGFSHSLAQELKGFAIIAIVFSHIGYFLVSDHRFLFPLSIMAGVGVNLFLLLSGFGLTMSAISKPLSVKSFYKYRLPKLYVPLWLSLILFFVLDVFVTKNSYGLEYIMQSFAGFFPRADLILDVNSPLWYFTLIVFYYFLFPLVFSRRHPWFSALILYVMGRSLIFWSPPILGQVMSLYEVHMLAFPVGVLLGGLFFWYKDYFINLPKHWVWAVVLSLLVAFTAYYSHVGDLPWKEELTSLFTVGLLILLFLQLKIENRLLYWFGVYSYEIYLLHWPILSRFDLFFAHSPAWLATTVYMIIFLVLGWGLEKFSKIVIKSGNVD
ncbi:MAG: acyltransferase family protein [Minisyncoccota bacterium]